MPKMLFIGSKKIGLCSLAALADRIPPQDLVCGILDDSSDSRSCLQEMQAFCGKRQLTHFLLRDNSGLKAACERHKPFCVVVVGWYQIIPPSLLAMVPGGFAGIHASALPRYRGGAPLVWALINGENQVGVSLFYFSAGMDDGRIIEQRVLEVGPDESIGDLLVRVQDASIEMLKQKARAILEGGADAWEQDHGQATYASQRRPEDGLINWNWPAAKVHNFIRAQSRPYPGAFSFTGAGQDGEQAIHIWRARIFPRPYYGPPGRVVQSGRRGMIVCCGQGAVEVLEASRKDKPGVALHELISVGGQMRI